VDKAHIISEIKRLATQNGGKQPGRNLFERETAIKMSDWYPYIWLRWGEALVEAGFSPNKLTAAISDDVLYQKYIDLTRELGHLPLDGERRRRARTDKSFPSHSTWQKLGDKESFIKGLLRFCENNPGNDDIAALCTSRSPSTATNLGGSGTGKVITGFVYLMKSGRHYKIGRTVSVGSRERQLAIKIPVPPTTIHSIETDDPVGIEAYWHRRFEAKRGEGEWFDLSPDDIKAFKRWKRIL
jgi:Meiotically up-regulated gene 113